MYSLCHVSADHATLPSPPPGCPFYHSPNTDRHAVTRNRGRSCIRTCTLTRQADECAHAHAYTLAYAYKCTRRWTYIHTRKWKCIHTRARPCTCTHADVNANAHVHASRNAHVHTHAHVHAHTHIHVTHSPETLTISFHVSFRKHFESHSPPPTTPRPPRPTTSACMPA